jgi:hypothetical protein
VWVPIMHRGLTYFRTGAFDDNPCGPGCFRSPVVPPGGRLRASHASELVQRPPPTQRPSGGGWDVHWRPTVARQTLDRKLLPPRKVPTPGFTEEQIVKVPCPCERGVWRGAHRRSGGRARPRRDRPVSAAPRPRRGHVTLTYDFAATKQPAPPQLLSKEMGEPCPSCSPVTPTTLMPARATSLASCVNALVVKSRDAVHSLASCRSPPSRRTLTPA